MPEPKKISPIDPGILLQRIKNNFPDLKWVTYQYIDEGWDHWVLILDNKLVFRFPNDDEYLGMLKNEIDVLKRLKPFISVKIPEYTYVASDYSFAGYSLISGKPLYKQVFDSLSPDDRIGIATQLADFLSTIHTLIQTGYDFTSITQANMKEDQARVKKQTQQYLRSVLNEADFVVVQQILAEVDTMIGKKLPTVFTHGDIYNNHLLWDIESKRLGIIDFSDMNRGDPAFDFAELYEYGLDFVRQVYSRYKGPKNATFLQRAWVYQRWVGIFMMVDHFIYHKTTWEKARETFDRVKYLPNK